MKVFIKSQNFAITINKQLMNNYFIENHLLTRTLSNLNYVELCY